jgi:ABC-type antimicrobial peptide transport system ATPase subunit
MNVPAAEIKTRWVIPLITLKKRQSIAVLGNVWTHNHENIIYKFNIENQLELYKYCA